MDVEFGPFPVDGSDRADATNPVEDELTLGRRTGRWPRLLAALAAAVLLAAPIGWVATRPAERAPAPASTTPRALSCPLARCAADVPRAALRAVLVHLPDAQLVGAHTILGSTHQQVKRTIDAAVGGAHVRIEVFSRVPPKGGPTAISLYRNPDGPRLIVAVESRQFALLVTWSGELPDTGRVLALRELAVDPGLADRL